MPLSKAIQAHIEFPSTQTHLLIGQVGINRAHPDYYALYLGNHILGGSGLTSILSDEVREQRGLAYSTKKVALETLKNFRNNAIDPQKLQDGKDNIIGGFALETASNANILTYLSIIGFYELPLDFLGTFIDKIKPISAYDIQKAYKSLINMDKLVVLSVGATK